MSNKFQNNILYNKPNVIIKNDNDVHTQKRVIGINKNKYPDNYSPPYEDIVTLTPGLIGDRYVKSDKPSDRFDPYTDFLFKKGLLKRDHVLRYNTFFLNVDSSFRNKVSNIITNNTIQLENNPLVFTAGSRQLYIKHSEHNFKVNDKISIQNISTIRRNLQLKYLNDYAPNTTTTNIIQLVGGSQYATIKTPHKLKFTNKAEVGKARDSA
jgi:hypothetical protein